jgi:hypothetical protein
MPFEPTDEPGFDDEIADDALDDEAAVDQLPAEGTLAERAGLGLDLPEADALDQLREEPFEDDEPD